MKTDNELIHEFMGENWKTGTWEWGPGRHRPLTIADLDHYRTSWNWLMPVVSRIGEYRLVHEEEANRVCKASIMVGIQYLYPEVVRFVKFLNDRKK